MTKLVHFRQIYSPPNWQRMRKHKKEHKLQGYSSVPFQLGQPSHSKYRLTSLGSFVLFNQDNLHKGILDLLSLHFLPSFNRASFICNLGLYILAPSATFNLKRSSFAGKTLFGVVDRQIPSRLGKHAAFHGLGGLKAAPGCQQRPPFTNKTNVNYTCWMIRTLWFVIATQRRLSSCIQKLPKQDEK